MPSKYMPPLLPLLIFFLLAAAFLSLGLGKYPLSPATVFNTLINPSVVLAMHYQVVWTIRMPRILSALLAGALLALSGAALQGVFHNPLVDPHVIGVTSGAAFGGTLAILLSAAYLLMMASAFGFGLIALLLVYALARAFKQESNLILVLAGVILSGFFSALVSLMQYLADTETKLPGIVFWLMGSFATADWRKLIFFAIPGLSAAIIMLRLRWRINVISMGDKDARTLGIDLKRAKWLILIMCAMSVASQVAVSGSIGWVGLVIPHFARILAGVDHRRLLPAACVLGGIFMIIVDDIARMLTAAEIPPGIITAIFGAPLFTLLLIRRSDRHSENI
ncbi:MAG: iron ABC transporter permease [Spirochaetaceae bacterium]|jgi:iron complex transport system permease protein|nr:iron ABC transporter permease [Spirochaetaceae bacterium]